MEEIKPTPAPENPDPYVHPLISWSVLIVAFLSAVTFAGVYIIIGKAEAAKDKILVQNYRRFSELYTTASLVTNIGKVEMSFMSDTAPITMRNFMRSASIGIFDNTLLRADEKLHIVETGLSAQQLNPEVVNKALGRGLKLRDNNDPTDYKRGNIVMKYGPDMDPPTFVFILKDGTKLPAGDYQVFGSVVTGMDLIEAAYARDISEESEDLPVLIRRVELAARSVE